MFTQLRINPNHIWWRNGKIDTVTAILLAYSLVQKLATSTASRPNQVRT